MAISPEKDVDGFRCDSCFDPATPLGIVNYLDYCGFEWTGKEVTIIGRSDIVGKPLAKLMTNKDATLTLCHSNSKLSNQLYDSDLIVCAVGKARFGTGMASRAVFYNLNSQSIIITVGSDGNDVLIVSAGFTFKP